MTSIQPNQRAEAGKRVACDYVAISSAIASLRYCSAVSSLQSGAANASGATGAFGADAGTRMDPATPIGPSTDFTADRLADGL